MVFVIFVMEMEVYRYKQVYNKFGKTIKCFQEDSIPLTTNVTSSNTSAQNQQITIKTSRESYIPADNPEFIQGTIKVCRVSNKTKILIFAPWNTAYQSLQRNLKEHPSTK